MFGVFQFQLRFSPALANKPSAPRPKASTPSKPFDPFENPQQGPLFVADLPPSHNLVLNKFAVVPEHFILATKSFKEQTHLLEADDLAATYACIEAYHNHNYSHDPGSVTGHGDGELFAFFNSGPHSGASQPHRHVQLLPVARMKGGLEGKPQWSVLADTLTPESDRLVKGLPFVTFAQAISPGMTPEELHEVYLALYRRALLAVQRHTGSADGGISEDGTSVAAKISYNMAMTRSTLVVCPRLSEGSVVYGKEGGVAGQLALNGTVLAGTALVKNEAEWNALRQGGGVGATALADVLSSIGVPPWPREDTDGKL